MDSTVGYCRRIQAVFFKNVFSLSQPTHVEPASRQDQKPQVQMSKVVEQQDMAMTWR